MHIEQAEGGIIKGTYILYTSMNSSLALLESLVHYDILDIPPQLYIIQLEVNDNTPLLMLPEDALSEKLDAARVDTN